VTSPPRWSHSSLDPLIHRSTYLSAEERRRQEHRRSELQLVGKIVYFFTSEDVTTDATYVVRTLIEALRRAA